MTQPIVTRFPGVQTRADSNIYQFGLRAPKDLAAHFPTLWAVRCSLKTSDLRAANEAAKALQAEWALRFDAMRTGKAAPLDLMALRAKLLAKVERRLAGFDKHIPTLTPEKRGELQEELSWQLLDARQGVAQGYISEVSEHFLSRYGYSRSTAADAEAMSFLVMELELLVEAITDQTRTFPIRVSSLASRRALIESAKGREKPNADSPIAERGKSGHKLSDALTEWSKAIRPQKTINAFTRHVRQFEELTGNPSLETIDKRVAIKFRDALTGWAMGEGKVASTADNVMVSVRALTNVALDMGWVESNPFVRLVVTQGGKDAEGREPWTLEELPVLFNDPIWHAYSLPADRKAGGPAAYWIPLIACYTGARLSEIAQLWKDDLKTTIGKERIEFRANVARSQKLKNDGSWRSTPMHRELIRLGLPAYTDSVKAGPLFPDLPVDGVNGAGGQFGQWFGMYKKGKGFVSSAKAFHSFRHTVATELRLQNATDAQADAITGHAGNGEGRRTYSATIGREAERLRHVINLLDYPNMNLPSHW